MSKSIFMRAQSVSDDIVYFSYGTSGSVAHRRDKTTRPTSESSMAHNSDSNLRKQLANLREDARTFFPHADEDSPDAARIEEEVARVMALVQDLISRSRRLSRTAQSSHLKNSRRMTSAVGLKRYECWDPFITYHEDTPIGRREAGEEEYPASAAEAEGIFLEAIEATIKLLNLADPTGIEATPDGPPQSADDSGRQTLPTAEGKGKKRGPKPNHEDAAKVVEIVAKVAPDRD